MDSNKLFSPVGATKEEKQNTEQYKVSFKDGKNGVYRSVIRFIPNYADPSRCTMIKSVSWVKNPITQKGMYVDDPRSIGQPSPVTDMYFNLYNTQIATYVDWAKQYLGSKKQYASLVQIVSDEQHPELVGQIRVFVYGKKVYEKLNNEEFPQGAGQQGINPFHPIYGRKFSIVCTNQSGYNNFDQSSFYDERNGNQILPSGMWYIDPANPNQYSVVDENTDPDVLMDYLSKNSPDLSKYDYHEWTEEQTKHVEEVLAIARNFMSTGSMAGTQTQTMQAGLQAVNTPHMPGATPAPAAPTYNPAPQFPGASMPGAAPAPAAPAYNPAPTAVPTPAPAVFNPTPAPVSPAPVAAPTNPAAPVAQAPTPTPGVSGVTPPVVTPKNVDAPAAAPAPGQGMNMDDILKQL